MTVGFATGLTEEDVQDQIDTSLAGVGAGGDMPAVTLRRPSTAFTLPAVDTRLPFDVLDSETDPTILSANIAQGTINILEAGLYLMYFETELLVDAGNANHNAEARFFIDGDTVNGGFVQIDVVNDSSTPGGEIINRLSHVLVADLPVGQLEVLVRGELNAGDPSNVTTDGAGTFGAVRLSGLKGDKGDTGSGSNITVNGGNIVDTVEFDLADFGVSIAGATATITSLGGSAPVYGQGFDSDRNDVVDTTGGANNWSTHTSLIGYTPPATGNYEITVHYTGGMDNSSDQDFQTQLLLTPGADPTGFISATEMKDANGTGPGGTNQRVPSALQDVVALTGGTPVTMEFQFSSSGGAFATCWYSYLTVKRVS